MVPHEVLSLILDRLSHYKIRNRQLQALCPLHQERNPSFYLDLDAGVWYCFGCGRGGAIRDLLVLLYPHSPIALGGALNGDAAKYFEFYEQMPYLLNFRNLVQLIKNKRGISENTLMQVNPKWCPPNSTNGDGSLKLFEGRVLFPCRHTSAMSSFVGYALDDSVPRRYLLPSGLKLLFPFGFGEMVEEMKKSKIIYIVEGLFDALSLWEISLPAVATLGNSLSFFAATFPEDCQIYLMPDNPKVDMGGRRFSVQWSVNALLIGRWDAKVAIFPSMFLKDANEALLAGELEAQIEKLWLYPVPEFLVGAAINHPNLISLNQVVSLFADCLPADYAAALIRWIRKKYPRYVLKFQSAFGFVDDSFEKLSKLEVSWRILLESAKTRGGREIILSVFLPNEIPYLFQMEVVGTDPPFPAQKILESARVIARYLRYRKARKLKSQLLSAAFQLAG